MSIACVTSLASLRFPPWIYLVCLRRAFSCDIFSLLWSRLYFYRQATRFKRSDKPHHVALFRTSMSTPNRQQSSQTITQNCELARSLLCTDFRAHLGFLSFSQHFSLFVAFLFLLLSSVLFVVTYMTILVQFQVSHVQIRSRRGGLLPAGENRLHFYDN